MAIATVVSALDPLRGELVGLGLAAATGESWYLPLAHRSGDGMFADQDGVANLPSLGHAAMASLREVLGDPAFPKAGHDVKRDWLVLRRAGVTLAGVSDDSMLASFVLDPGKRSYALDAVSAEHLGRVVRSPVDLARPARDATPVADLPVAEAGRIAGQAAAALLELRELFAPELKRLGLGALLEQIEIPLIGVLADIEWRGICLEPLLLAELSRQFGAELRQLEQAIYQEAGTEFNINSTPQLRHILFEKLQLPVQKKTKTGASTDADVLQQLADLGFAVPKLLLEYRELSKLKSTYVDVLPLSVNPRTGRIHTQFNQTGAATGRLSSSDPNLQSIP
ncbi:MAG: DNA polymerase, partial [Dehalococcoidia bacterium]